MSAKTIIYVAALILFFWETSFSQNLYNDTTILEFRIEFTQADWRTILKNNVPTETDIPATIFVNGIRFDSVGVRYKGNSSYNVASDKKPFNISMDAFKPNQLLWGYKTLNFNNCFKDPTFVREKIAYEIASKYLPSAKTAFINLYVNNENFGVYLHVQQLNKIFLREWFSSANGNHFKGDPQGDLRWYGNDTNLYKQRYELKTNEEENNWRDLILFIDKLNNLPTTQFADSIIKYLNVDRALWYIAFCNLYVNLDSHIGSGHNFYFYHNPSDDRFQIIPWDLNEILGTFSQALSIQQREQLSVFYKSTDLTRPLVSKLLSVPDFKERYIAHYRTMFEETFNQNYWLPKINLYQKLILPHVQADTKKLYSIDLFTQNVNSNVQTGGAGMPGGTIPGIFTLINNRTTFLKQDSFFTRSLPIIDPNVLKSTNKANTEIVFTSKILNCNTANFWYSVNDKSFNSVKMNLTSDNIYSATISPQTAGTILKYYIEAITQSGAKVFMPQQAEHSTFLLSISSTTTASPVVINEFLASNITSNKDPQGEFDDWIELFNTTSSTINIGGKFLTDDKTKPTKWKIPAGTTINANGYLIIWADEDTDTVGLHANFKLSKSGEVVHFYDSTSSGITLLDSISFGTQQDDISLGRIPNGSGNFVFTKPTPLAINTPVVYVENNNNQPKSFNLSQNYPNPFNSTTKINFSIPKKSFIQLKVYNLLGVEIATVVDELKEAGFYSVSFNGVDLPTGIYLYKLSTSYYTEVKKFVLIK
ncbi:MAG: CotH kinase family protein [Bacteroidetes bacterium]|nr:CotH kinase family protein [Bacteroidota bacterium]